MKPRDRDDIYYKQELDLLNSIETDECRKEVRDAKRALKRKMSKKQRSKDKQLLNELLDETQE